jgi:hypothetical protein
MWARRALAAEWARNEPNGSFIGAFRWHGAHAGGEGFVGICESLAATRVFLERSAMQRGLATGRVAP